MSGLTSAIETTTPSAPASGSWRIYPTASGWTAMNAAGSTYLLGQISGMTAGYVAFGGTSTPLAADSNLVWDNTNKRLGIGNPSPSYSLDIVNSLRVVSAVSAGGSYNAYHYNVATNSAGAAVFPASVLVESDITNSAGATYGSEFTALQITHRYRGAATINAVNLRDVVGIAVAGFNYNTGTTPYVVGFQADMRNLGTSGVYGNITNLVHFHARATIVSGGTVTNKFSFKSESGAGSASFYDGVNVGTATGASAGFVRVPSGAGGVSFGGDGYNDIYRFDGTTKGTAGNYLRIDAYSGISLGTSQSGGQQAARLTIDSTGNVLVTGGYLDVALADSGTATIANGIGYRHRTSGTPAANFGTSMFAIADDNGADDQTLYYVPSYWTDATHASRKSRTDFYAYDSAGARLAMAIGANGSSVLVGFFGTAPIAKPTGVAVSAAGIHAALVSLGLIAA